MPRFYGGTPVALNGVTWVEIVAAPVASTRREVLAVYVNNRDSADRVIKLRKLIGATGYEDFPWFTIPAGLRAQILPAPIVLDATDMSLQISADAAPATTQPRADVSVFEEP